MQPKLDRSFKILVLCNSVSVHKIYHITSKVGGDPCRLMAEVSNQKCQKITGQLKKIFQGISRLRPQDLGNQKQFTPLNFVVGPRSRGLTTPSS